MTPEQREELETLVTRDEALNEDDQARFRELESVYAEHDRTVKLDEERQRIAAALKLDAPIIVESSDRSYDEEEAEAKDVKSSVWDLDVIGRIDTSPDELLARAIGAASETPGPTDRRREALVSILETHGDEKMARIALATTSPEYKSAFSKTIRSMGQTGTGPTDLTEGEAKAMAFATSLARAMSVGTDAGGGYLVPTDIESAVTLTADGSSNPIYNLARRVQTTGDTYRVVGSPNAAWSWDGENTEVSDDTPTFTNTDITLYVGQGFVPVSFRSQQATNGLGIAQQVLDAGWNDLVGAALATGSGSSQPFGIVTAIAGTGNAVASAGTDVFAVADVYTLQNAINERYRNNATWIMNNGITNLVRQFATDDGHALLARLGDGDVGTLLGRPVVEVSEMDGVINATATNNVAVFGDFSHYVVAEAIGTMVRIIPDVFGSTGRPIGATGVYMQTSFGADSVNDAAFGLLDVT